MKCRKQDVACLYSNNMLSPDERERFEAHLESCGDCRAAVEGETRMMESYLSAARVQPPKGLEAGILRRLENGRRQPARVVNGVNRFFTGRVIPAAALVAAVMLFIILLSPQESDMQSSFSTNTGYASMYMPAYDQAMISNDGKDSYTLFLSSMEETDSPADAGQGM